MYVSCKKDDTEKHLLRDIWRRKQTILLYITKGKYIFWKLHGRSNIYMQKFLVELQAQQHFLLLLEKMTRACPKFIPTYKVNVLRQNSFLFLSGGNLLCVSAFERSRGTSHDIHYYQPINLLVTPEGISVKGGRTILTEGMPQRNEKMLELPTSWPLQHMGGLAWKIAV